MTVVNMTGQRVGTFRNYLRIVNYDMPDIAKVFDLDPEKLKTCSGYYGYGY